MCAVLHGGVARGPQGAGGRSTSVRPSAFPGKALKWVLLASLSSWRTWPPYCSIRVRVLIPGVVRVAPLCAGASRLLVAVSVGAGGRARGGAWRTGLPAFPPWAPRPFRGEGELPPGLVGGRGSAPPRPVSGSPLARGGGVGGVGGGVCAVVPRFLLPGGGLWVRSLALLHGRRRGAAHSSLLHARPGLFGSPRRRARSGWPPVDQSGGGGMVGAPPLLAGSAGRPRGAGGWKVVLLRFVSLLSPGGHQGVHRHCPALHTAVAHVCVPPSW